MWSQLNLKLKKRKITIEAQYILIIIFQLFYLKKIDKTENNIEFIYGNKYKRAKFGSRIGTGELSMIFKINTVAEPIQQ